MSPFVPVDEEQRVTGVDEAGASGTVRDTDALAVSGDQEAVRSAWTATAWKPP